MSALRTIFTLNPAKGFDDPKAFASYVNPNARCPVCRDLVYFYQSEFGGRVFFDELGGDWKKHPCTDNSKFRTSNKPIEFVDGNEGSVAIGLITELNFEGYAPLICISTKGSKQISGEFVFHRKLIESGKAKSVWLYLSRNPYSGLSQEARRQRFGPPINIVPKNTLFFIKEISAKRGEYLVRFCFQREKDPKIYIENVEARITSFIRPVMMDNQVTFEDFSETGQVSLLFDRTQSTKRDVRIVAKKPRKQTD